MEFSIIPIYNGTYIEDAHEHCEFDAENGTTGCIRETVVFERLPLRVRDDAGIERQHSCDSGCAVGV